MMALPVFSPCSIPMKAAGMFSKPFVTCSRHCNFPCRWTIKKFHKWQWSKTGQPIFGRLNMTSKQRMFLQGSYLVFSNHWLTSFNHPISLLRDSGCLCSHRLCMKPSILSCFKIMVRWGYGPESTAESWRGQWNYISKSQERHNFSSAILPSCGRKLWAYFRRSK